MSACAVAPPARATASATRLALGEAVEAGPPHRAGDVDDELRRRRRRARGRARRPAATVAAPAPASVRPATTSSTRAPPRATSARRRETGREGMSRACRENRHGVAHALRADCVPIAASDDEVDELAGHDDRLPRLAAVQVRLHALATPAPARRAPPPPSVAGTCSRSRSLPFTCTTSSKVSRSSMRRVGHRPRLSHSRSPPSRSHSSSATCGANGWISETAVSAAKRAAGSSGVRRDLVDQLHHGGDRRVEGEAPADVVGDLRDRLVRLPRQRPVAASSTRGFVRLPRARRARAGRGSAAALDALRRATPCPGRPGP